MHIDRRDGRAAQKPGRQDLAKCRNRDEIGPKPFKNRPVFFLPDLCRLIDRNAIFRCKQLHGRWLRMMTPSGRPVRLRENRTDFISALEECAQ